MYNQTKGHKFSAKDYIITIVIFIAFALLFYFILKTVSVPKATATDKQVWDMLVANGYIPQDLTQKRLDKEPDCGIIKNITATKEDIHFEFNVFDSEKTAVNVYAKYRSFIREKEFHRDMGYYAGKGNYIIYATTTHGKYYVIVQVGNTIIFATCDNENQITIQQLLIYIDYPSHTKNSSSATSNTWVRIGVYSFALLPLTWVSLRWLWDIICKCAGTTKREFRLYRLENKHHFSFESSNYYFLSQKIKNPRRFKTLFFVYKMCFLPCWLAIFLEIISFFIDSVYVNSNPFAFTAIAVILVSGFGDIIYNRVYLPRHKSPQ